MWCAHLTVSRSVSVPVRFCQNPRNAVYARGIDVRNRGRRAKRRRRCNALRMQVEGEQREEGGQENRRALHRRSDARAMAAGHFLPPICLAAAAAASSQRRQRQRAWEQSGRGRKIAVILAETMRKHACPMDKREWGTTEGARERKGERVGRKEMKTTDPRKDRKGKRPRDFRRPPPCVASAINTTVPSDE